MGKINWNGETINELLVNGNAKIGKNVYHFSTLPTCKNGGTCFETCPGCYGTKGNYNFPKVREALATRTRVAREDLPFFTAEIVREIKAHKVQYVRIHATGDFFSRAYAEAWLQIVKECPGCTFWTYTKSYGHGFDDVLNEITAQPNCNIVESIISGCGFNFGHVGYLLDTYYKLVADGETPYICKCGVDPNQHCNNCTACSTHKHVLFIEHSTDYKADKDPLFVDIKKLIESQDNK